MSSHAISHQVHHTRRSSWVIVALSAGLLAALLIWLMLVVPGSPNPTAPNTTKSSAILDVGILVFREGLECVLVLAAITASMTGVQEMYRRPVAAGAGFGFLATLVTWFLAVRILDDISAKVSALSLQAGTGLLAVIVLLIVMNWFFHKTYWTGWISLHNRRKRDLLTDDGHNTRKINTMIGFALLGFSSLYREGVEVVLFLQSYRLKLGNEVVLYGVILGLILSAAVAILTFVAHRKLPYKRMLILTGIMLAVVLFVMVGEQAQEMQLAHWLPATEIPWLATKIPAWMGLWFSVFPTVESLSAQVLALVLILGSYFVAQNPPRSSGKHSV